MWYGLYINGECQYAIRWDQSGKPTTFDFNVPILSSTVYEIIRVDVIGRY